MNSEEARKILWLKSNPRPLGELLDDGYLTLDRLKWAAQWAYNFDLKQAAQVLLEEINSPSSKIEKEPKPLQENSLPIEITLDQARATLWPFPPYKGQTMGTLVESMQISLKDLGYAIDNAWNERVKQAAIALSLVRLEQVVKEPQTSAGFVNVVSKERSFAKQSESFLILLEGIFLGFVFSIMLAILYWTIFDLTRPHANSKSLGEVLSTPGGAAFLVIAIGTITLIGWLVASIPDQIMKRFDRSIDEYRLGQEGEDRVVQLIVQVLDGNWHLFRNVNLPGRNKADLDLVLVGPPGVWVLEVKNYRGVYRNIGDIWEFRRGESWKKTRKSPSQQALNGAVRLANFLRADHLDVFVNAVVVWANVESPLTVENPFVVVWLYDRLPDELGNIWQAEKLTVAERNKISAKLTKLSKMGSKLRK